MVEPSVIDKGSLAVTLLKVQCCRLFCMFPGPFEKIDKNKTSTIKCTLGSWPARMINLPICL